MEQPAVDYVHQLYAPPDDPVFQLVPPTFENFISVLYMSMDSPVVTRQTVWDIYRELHHRFSHLDEALVMLPEWEAAAGQSAQFSDSDAGCEVELLQGLKDLEDQRGPDAYMGGVNNGRGLGQFTDFVSLYSN